MPTKDTTVKYTCTETSTFYDSRIGPVTSFVQNTYNLPVGSSASATGSLNPSWKKQITAKTDASTGYSATFYSLKGNTPWRCQVKTLVPPGSTPDYLLDAFRQSNDIGKISLAPDTNSSLDAQALERIKNKLREATGAVSTMAPLAELKDLRRTIVQAANLTSQTLHALRDLRKLRTKRARRLMQDTWLGWNFGIAPMVSDISKIGNSIAKYMSRQDLVMKVSGSAKTDRFGFYDPQFTFPDTLGTMSEKRGQYHQMLSYRYIGAYKINLRSSNNYSMADNLGIDLRSLPATLWELTAFSWIVDYFTNVGEFLEDTFESPPADTIYLVRTILDKSEFTNTRIPKEISFNPNNIAIVSSSPGLSSVGYVCVSRTVLGSLPATGLRLKSVDEIGIHAVSKLLNLASLMK